MPVAAVAHAGKNGEDSETAKMFRAAMREDIDTLRLLIANGSDMTATNFMGQVGLASLPILRILSDYCYCYCSYLLVCSPLCV